MVVLYKIKSVLCNMGALCDRRIVLCGIRSVLCDVGGHYVIWVYYDESPM